MSSIIYLWISAGFFLQKLYSQFRIVSFNSDDRASQQGHSEGLTPIYSKSCIKNITNGS